VQRGIQLRRDHGQGTWRVGRNKAVHDLLGENRRIISCGNLMPQRPILHRNNSVKETAEPPRKCPGPAKDSLYQQPWQMATYYAADTTRHDNSRDQPAVENKPAFHRLNTAKGLSA
jgi:hypothetical protein